ncbi:MAG: 4Fe-4S dicluster domain-containing protein [Alphaproteobacteria bacterium]|jgi:ferredoxin|nr:4Fe-4S dicluster domain-containing protein [Alphaproteobacteria bacterium]
MAMKIDAGTCSVCGACEFECPNVAIRMKGDSFTINAKKCNECEGHADTPQCIEVCPSDSIVQA